MRILMAEELKQQGASVVEAADASAALESLKTEKFDFLITDLNLPGGGGSLVLETIKAHDIKLKKIIVISGQVPEPKSILGELGAVALIKPFRMSELIKCFSGF